MYYLIAELPAAINLIKATYLSFAFIAAFSFFSLFHGRGRAFAGAIILVLSPLYDGATVWFTGQYLILSLGFFLLAFVRASQSATFSALALSTLGSFCSYGSPPLALGFGAIFMMQRNWAAAAKLLIPNLIYCAYYVYTSVFLSTGIKRLPADFSVLLLAKNYLVQIGSSIDAIVGPSAWLKLVLSIANISGLSLLVAVFFVLFFLRRLTDETRTPTIPAVNKQLLIGSALIVVAALGIFALNGAYPQIAFNLGNRVLVYCGILLAVLIVQFASNRVLGIATMIIIFGFLGICDHWKGWNVTLTTAAEKIHGRNFESYGRREILVGGLQYSKLGSMAHIDHFASSYVVQEFFKFAKNDDRDVMFVSFNRRLRLGSDSLSDVKYGEEIRVGESIVTYDAALDKVTTIPKAEIPAAIGALPPDQRHWIQFLGPGILTDILLLMSPRLAYLFQ
jgi:hypothetical protein